MTDIPNLDPDDWEAFRRSCHRTVDELVDRFQRHGEGPVWRETPEESLAHFRTPLPRAGRDLDAVLADVREHLLPHTLGNTHPRWFGWVHGAGTPTGALAELISGAINANMGGRNHAPLRVEEQVLEWSKEMVGFPEGASGLLVSGTSMATITALAVARHQATRGRDREEGLRDASALVGYTSADAHHSVRDAFSLLGLGSDQLRGIELDARRRMDPGALEAAIRADLAAGRTPFAVIANAGSVSCGAVDDLEAIRRIADRYDLWMHVDGAFGVATRLSSIHRHRLTGIAAADSVAFDFHKWFHVPYEAGCVLIRDAELHQAAFGGRAGYLTSLPEGPGSGEVWPCDLGPELSRGFRAFKVWLTLQTLGADAIGRAVDHNVELAQALARRVDREPELERLAPAELNIVCFQYRTEEMLASGNGSVDEVNDLNREILMELHRRGIAVPSPIELDGRLAIRVCLCNHRTRADDLRALTDAVLELGRALVPVG